MPRDSYSGHLDLVLLAALKARPMHGYAIIDFVRQTSGGQFDYPEGTIYPALRRLEDDRLVQSRWSETDGRRRRVYQLTAAGAKALAAHKRSWERYRTAIEAVLG
jgi:PadR family transcriptional regulator, regulatory protein PadR